MNKTIALLVGIFMLFGFAGAVAQNSVVTTSDETQDIQAINTAALASADSVPSMVDPGRVINTPLRIGESAWGRYQASCQKVRQYIWQNVIDLHIGHHKSIGDYRMNAQAVDINGRNICQLEQYSETETLGKCKVSVYDSETGKKIGDTNQVYTNGNKKKVYNDSGNWTGEYELKHKCLNTQSVWTPVTI